ncbi:membrane-bound lytic murein transglycosylase C [Marinospirillum celere]|uniref:Membrane-bound lytic murein transglycosylase C n=1 Tax=Marinospirillum celere TaxID=1122252 RepID=A0A1I1G7G1_9GAMM|nr:transglycosylase SLT domain-containing protein [Marinospirillum celere]SFC07495.1 membrane-bound lytic murein transglycosylase C [Marinospirillum celere]
MKKVLLGVLGAGLILLPTVAASSSFEEFQQQQRQGLQQFQQDFDAAFQAYQDAFNEAFAAYQEELRAHWQEPLLTDRHTWVEYSQDQSSRSIVDFQANQIRIEIDSEKSGGSADAAVELLVDVINRPVDEAVERDEVTQRAIEKAGLPSESLGTQGQKRVLNEVQPEHAEQMMNEAEVSQRQEPAPDGSQREVIVLTVPLPPSRTTDKAREYLPLIKRHAKHYDIEPALMLAIMHSESSFNPMARSHIPAFGLMQIVPGSAGRDVAQVVYGEDRVFSPSYLYNPDNNVRAGAVYLDILNSRYLRQIEHPESRLYAVIAAYNTGAGNVARTFTGGSTSPAQAARIINEMQPKDVYDQLRAQLPYEETRNYLDHVARRTLAYREFE